MLLVKSDIPKNKLIKKIYDIFSSQKLLVNNIGKEKNKDKNRGIKTKLIGIKNLKDSSKVKEWAIQ